MRSFLDGAIILILFTSIAGAWWAAAGAARQAEERALAVAFQHAEDETAATELLLRHFGSGNRLLADLSQRWLRLSGLADQARRAEVDTSLAQMLEAYDLPIGHLTIADSEGQIRWHTAQSGLNLSIAGRPHFTAHQDGHPGPLVSRPRLKQATGEVVIPVSWRLRDAEGGFIGVAVMEYLPEKLSTSLAGISTHANRRVALVNLEGALLARSQPLPERLGDIVVPAAAIQGLAEARTRRVRAANIVDGRPTIIALRHSPEANLVIVATAHEATVLAPAHNLSRLAHLAAGAYTALILLAMAIGYGILRGNRLRREAAMLRAGRAQVERLHAKLPAVIFLREVAADGSSRVIYRAGDVRGVTGWHNGELDDRLDWSGYYAEPEQDRDFHARRALAEGSAEAFWGMRQPDGGVRPMVTRLERLSQRPDGGGEVIGYVRDYTAEQRASEIESDSRRELESTLGLAPVVVFRARVWTCGTCTRHLEKGCHRVDYVSTSLERVTGWTRDALTAAGGLATVLSPWEAMIEGIEVMRGDSNWGGEFHLRRPDGEQIVVRITTSVVTHHFDGVDIVGYIADVTEERDAKVRAIGSARLASLGELAAGLAHELKQPLQAIELGVTNAQTAAKRGNMAAVDQRLERIATYSRRAAAVVEHLRRLARGADESAPPEPVVLEESVAAVLGMLAGPLRDAGVEIEQQFASHPLVAIGHAVALEQVLMNLIGNARDALSHLPADSRRVVTITGRRAAAGDGVVLTVADNGGGIPPKVMERLFQPFVTTKGLERGTGLGLSICQGLIRHMGDTIAATNDEQGAVFTIALPGAEATMAEKAEPLRQAAE